jgi:DNA-binding GntR family transcriptional regulator
LTGRGFLVGYKKVYSERSERNQLDGRNPVAAGAYERLKADIVGFVVPPGERLVELELCERYGVSRTPVREALRRLEDEGFVHRREKGGRFVRALDLEAYRDVYRVRMVLEDFAVREVCARAGHVDLDALEHAWRAGFPSDTTPLDGSYVVADERFHLGLARASGNAYLVSALERIHDRLREIRSVDFTERERLVDSEAQHLAIVAAIRRGEVEEASLLLESHIAQSIEEIRAISMRIFGLIHGGRAVALA